ncbi:MAG: hypothetical protein LBS43_07700 [Prevotellaceae bacterium]|jgi:hypothetical protein|nr:hypothetical protein [Prevotellaceae bacterium]
MKTRRHNEIKCNVLCENIGRDSVVFPKQRNDKQSKQSFVRRPENMKDMRTTVEKSANRKSAGTYLQYRKHTKTDKSYETDRNY